MIDKGYCDEVDDTRFAGGSLRDACDLRRLAAHSRARVPAEGG